MGVNSVEMDKVRRNFTMRLQISSAAGIGVFRSGGYNKLWDASVLDSDPTTESLDS
jgi:hypothetical protein